MLCKFYSRDCIRTISRQKATGEASNGECFVRRGNEIDSCSLYKESCYPEQWKQQEESNQSYSAA
ncbi:hypothetical protein E2542_SST21582 [Spatholobus suberectus]|nr:hypothetical protein E2542_SST21582 [Spatholobus suberectus]